MTIKTETVQILGHDLADAVRDLNIKAELKYTTPETGKFEKLPKFEVWEMSQETFEAFCNVDDDDWKDEYGWWRYGERSSEDFSGLNIVNGHEMIAFPPEEHAMDFPSENADGEEEEEEEEESGPLSYRHFLQYLDYNQGMSTERNIAITAISLAKANGLTLAEFMNKYYGEEVTE